MAAASGNFRQAQRLQQDALDEAKHYDLPTEGPLSRLKAYKLGRIWIDAG